MLTFLAIQKVGKDPLQPCFHLCPELSSKVVGASGHSSAKEPGKGPLEELCSPFPTLNAEEKQSSAHRWQLLGVGSKSPGKPNRLPELKYRDGQFWFPQVKTSTADTNLLTRTTHALRYSRQITSSKQGFSCLFRFHLQGQHWRRPFCPHDKLESMMHMGASVSKKREGQGRCPREDSAWHLPASMEMTWPLFSFGWRELAVLCGAAWPLSCAGPASCAKLWHRGGEPLYTQGSGSLGRLQEAGGQCSLSPEGLADFTEVGVCAKPGEGVHAYMSGRSTPMGQTCFKMT